MTMNLMEQRTLGWFGQVPLQNESDVAAHYKRRGPVDVETIDSVVVQLVLLLIAQALSADAPHCMPPSESQRPR